MILLKRPEALFELSEKEMINNYCSRNRKNNPTKVYQNKITNVNIIRLTPCISEMNLKQAVIPVENLPCYSLDIKKEQEMWFLQIKPHLKVVWNVILIRFHRLVLNLDARGSQWEFQSVFCVIHTTKQQQQPQQEQHKSDASSSEPLQQTNRSSCS